MNNKTKCLITAGVLGASLIGGAAVTVGASNSYEEMEKLCDMRTEVISDYFKRNYEIDENIPLGEQTSYYDKCYTELAENIDSKSGDGEPSSELVELVEKVEEIDSRSEKAGNKFSAQMLAGLAFVGTGCGSAYFHPDYHQDDSEMEQ